MANSVSEFCKVEGNGGSEMVVEAWGDGVVGAISSKADGWGISGGSR